MLVPNAINPIPLARALPGAVRDEALTAIAPGERAAGGGAVARPLESPFSRAADGATLLAAQEAREDPGGRQGPSANPRELSRTEELEVRRMARRDAEVRRHELAHAAAGGPHVGVAEYKYQRGPDGKLYAVGGRVSIDVAPARTPEATIRKMDTVIRAAMAPLNPSMEDRAAAVLALQIKHKAFNEGQAEKKDGADVSSRGRAASPAASDPNARSFAVPPAEAAAYQQGAEQTRKSRQQFGLGTQTGAA